MDEAPAPEPDEPDGVEAAERAGALAEQRRQRAAKLAALAARGVDPYPDRYDRSALASELHDRFGGLDDGAETGVVERVAGRVMLLRRQGKLVFVTLRDRSGQIQLFVSLGAMGEDGFAAAAELDLGDWVGAEGEVIKTRRGELSIKTTAVTLLAKALRPLPDKWRGLADTEVRYRQRYVDLIVNADARRVFDIRHTVISSVRAQLAERGFVEVETPILQVEAGGAAARPFVTHHNALDLPMYLRIATELHLKRLVVGGYERVFEIGRIFRNEGIDTRHNPEFTMVEVYQALADYRDMMALTEELVSAAALAALGTTLVDSGDGSLNLTPPWPRLPMTELIAEATGRELDPAMGAAELRAACDELGVAHQPFWGPGKLVFEVFDQLVERTLRGPLFVIGYPAEVSPLARRSKAAPLWADRFEAFVLGRELANGFSELNQPDLQREAFEHEVSLAAAGDEEAQKTVDEDYLRALEFALPPTGGLGVGIDRLVMLLAGVNAIREVILFPTLRPER